MGNSGHSDAASSWHDTMAFANQWPGGRQFAQMMMSAENDSRPRVENENDSRPPVENAARRLGVLISGRGSNLQSIIDAIAAGALDASIALVISNRPDAQGLLRARVAGIDALVVSPRDFAHRDA